MNLQVNLDLSSLTPNTVEDIFPLAEKFATEFSYPGGFSRSSFKLRWEPLISHGVGHIVVAKTAKPEIVGTIGYVFTTDPFNGWPTCLVNFWYAFPEFRGNGLGARLFHVMSEHAKEYGCKRILAGHSTRINRDGFETFFKRHGFRPIETGYEKHL